MNLGMIFSNLFKNVGTFTKTNAPTLLTGTGLALGATTVVLVAKKSPEAKKRKEKALIKAQAEGKTKLATTVDVVKAVAPVYALPIATGLAAGGCIIASDIVVNKRLTTATRDLAAVTAGYAALQDKFNNYKETAKEVLGENKKKDLDRKAEERAMERSEAKEEDAEIVNFGDDGDKMLCYDRFSDRYFRASMDQLRKAENKMNLFIYSNDSANINDWYDILGIRNIKPGCDWGWTSESIIFKNGIDLDSALTCTLSPTNTPCTCVDFDTLVPMWRTRK